MTVDVVEIINSVCASAPGKVILFGEHSVVYGKPAIAASLSDLRIEVLIQLVKDNNNNNNENNNTSRIIKIEMLDLPCPINCYISAIEVQKIVTSMHAPPTTDCIQILKSLIQEHIIDCTNGENNTGIINNNELSIQAIMPVLYLITQLTPPEQYLLPNSGSSSYYIKVKSKNLPVGAGLGSSAAFGVACTAAFIQLLLKQNNNNQQQQQQQQNNIISGIIKPDTDTKNKINQYAYYSEILLHGHPSGIDNTVSTYGGAIKFTKKNDNNNVSFDPIELVSSRNNNKLKLILVYTHVPRQTKLLVAGVRELYNQFPNIINPILDAMGNIVVQFCETVTKHNNNNNDNNDNNEEYYKTIMSLVRMNQSLLSAIGVSHTSLDRICTTVQQVVKNNANSSEEAAAAKLTGAGGGGCAMILLADNNNDDDDLEQQIIDALTKVAQPEYNFTFFTSIVGGDGVLFVPPDQFGLPSNNNT